MSESPDRERAALEEIERELSTQSPRLARRLRAPGRWTRWIWGPYRNALIALLLIVLLSLTAVALGQLH